MQVDNLAVELRPRPMAEAADLGVRLVQANAGSVWRTCAPVFLGVALLCLSTGFIASWLPGLMMFWLKPWMDRSLLFVLSRAVFGQPTRWTDLWQAQRSVWWQGVWRTLLWRRFSPWRAFTLPIEQLEGQRGAARSARRQQLLSGQRGAAGSLQAVFAHLELFFSLSILALVQLFAPEGTGSQVWNWLTSDAWQVAMVQAGTYMLLVACVEPFYVAAGFAMYLNRRVQLESWDIEQEFRRAFT
ncbi:MAG: hypothetical protein V4739_00830 [Pseudomonadota bacterium]